MTNTISNETMNQVKEYIEYTSDLDVADMDADQSVNFVMDLLNDTELENAIISMAYENSIPVANYNNFYEEVETYLNTLTEEGDETNNAEIDKIITKYLNTTTN